MSSTKRALVTCGTLAAIGAVSGQHLKQVHWLFSIALPVLFGVVGYVAYDARGFINIIKNAYDKASDRQVDLNWWRKFLTAYLYCFGGVGVWFITLMGTANFIDRLTESGHKPVTLSFSLLISSVLSLLVVYLLHVSDINDTVEDARLFAKKINPISIFFYHLPKVIIKGIANIPKVLRGMGKFMKFLFMYLHADDKHGPKMVWLLSIGMGVATGELMWHTLTAAITGFAIGGFLAALDTGVFWDRLNTRAVVYMTNYRSRHRV